MSVTGTTTDVVFAAAGHNGVVAFDFTFHADSATWVKTSVDGAVQNSGVTVTLHADQGATPGGTVTYDVAPGNATEVIVYREIPLTQSVALTAYGPFPSTTMESALDRAVLVAQELEARIADLETRVTALEP
jgi:hypothetical protein